MTDILYGSAPSLYSGKARAYMDWKALDYREELCTPDIQRSVVIPNVGRPVMPVVQLVDGTVIQDTTCIIDHYENISDGPSVYPDTPVQKLVALLLELYGDEWLVIPAMHYRWNFNEEWIYGEFGQIALPDGTADEQYEIGKKNGQMFRGFVPVLGVNEDTIPAIEKSYEALLADLNAHFEDHDYLLGSRPSIGDYGLIGPLYAHLYRDPKSGDLMERLAPRVAEWVRRMMDAEMPLSGEFLPDDAIPDTLLPVLSRMMAEQMPCLQATAKNYAAWATANPGADVPRAVGTAPYRIEGVSGERMASTFSLWMLQRPLDFYRSLDGATLEQADALLEEIGGAALAEFDLSKRVAFENHAIVQA